MAAGKRDGVQRRVQTHAALLSSPGRPRRDVDSLQQVGHHHRTVGQPWGLRRWRTNNKRAIKGGPISLVAAILLVIRMINHVVIINVVQVGVILAVSEDECVVESVGGRRG